MRSSACCVTQTTASTSTVTVAVDAMELVVNKEKFIERFLKTTNELRKLLGDRLLTYEDLVRVGVTAERCTCSDKTCPGWGMRFER